jgi:tetratricopeptide (TPR) repeat protein
VTDIRDPDTAAAYLAQAEEFARHKDKDRMTEALERLAASPDCSAAHRFKGAQLFADAGATADAIRFYRDAGNAYIDPEADTGRAREAFGAAHALDLHDLEIVFAIARVDRIEGHPRAALAKFTHILSKTKQSHVPALFEAACIYQELGQHDQAVLTLRKVLDRDKTNVQAIINMGQRLQSMGMLPEAIGYFNQAAVAAQSAGQSGTCRHLLNMVIGLDTNNQQARRLLAELDDVATSTGPEEVAAPRIVPREPPSPQVAVQPAAEAELPAVAEAKASDPALEAELNQLSVRNDRMQRKMSAIASSVEHLEETVATLKAEVAELKRTAQPRKTETVEIQAKVPAPKAMPVDAQTLEPTKPKTKKSTAAAKPRKAAPAKARSPRR